MKIAKTRANLPSWLQRFS